MAENTINAPVPRGEAGKLAGIGVWVTRPSGQADTLARGIEREGGNVIRLPVIAIADVDNRTLVEALMDRLGSFDLAIFVSVNAVRKGIHYVGGAANWPKKVRIAAIGKATTRALEERGLSCAFEPMPPYNSESLLALPELRADAITGSRVIVFRGVGGRALLGEVLTTRRARVEYAEVYRRILPQWVGKTPIPWEKIEIIVVTSGEGLENLFAIAGDQERERLGRMPLVVISKRMARFAGQLGVRFPPIVADNASDAAILSALRDWNADKSP
uniref:Uroporphyrinogen-III synthase n=1 Tax=Candidatus Kentrum sp. TC TaxID=2126339 RepID=A0A450Y7Y0_9GAMM|nr:MAG: uroporphyrinogen-III synthase [Candidatus Kentron sp. TC]